LVLFIIVTGALMFHFRFLNRIELLTTHKNTLEAQQIILKDAAAYLSEVRAQLCEIKVIANTPLQQNQYLQTLHQTIITLQDIIQIMEKGGEYHEQMSLNTAGQDQYQHIYRIHPFKHEMLTPLLCSRLQIDRYEQKIKLFVQNVLQGNRSNNVNAEHFKHNRIQLAIDAKNKDAYFRRLDENFNVILTQNLSELHGVTHTLNTTQKQFRLFSMFISIVTLILVGLFAAYFTRRTHKENKILTRQLYTDDLTQLGSRKALEAKSFGAYSIVYLVDLDNFSDTNSLYGNELGDLLLQAVALRIKNNCAPCHLHRFGGDVFAMMAPDLRQTDLSIKKRIHYIEDLIEGKVFKIQDYKFQVGITIGVGVGVNAIAQAMMALDIAKSEKKPYQIYSRRNHHARMIQEQLSWQKRLNRALRENTILPFVQPITNAHGHIIYYECLMRIAEPTGEHTLYIPPIFLEAAKKAKLYPRLSRVMIQKSFEKFHDGGSFSINLSYLDIKASGTKFFLEELIERHHAQGRVTFELLEHESLDDFDLVKSFLESFKPLGVKIAIDDFGSNYSNLMEIIRFRPDYIKIDGSLIRNLSPGNDAYIAVTNIVKFAHQLEIKTVAEYVEDAEIYALCQQMDIDLFQGYYFSPPVQNPTEISTDEHGAIVPS
jgi:diguanylate cyclase (GGDEF)-like protein